MPALRFLNLSHNALRGAIPVSLADMNVFEVVYVRLCVMRPLSTLAYD